jgi:hypothetical protein
MDRPRSVVSVMAALACALGGPLIGGCAVILGLESNAGTADGGTHHADGAHDVATRDQSRGSCEASWCSCVDAALCEDFDEPDALGTWGRYGPDGSVAAVKRAGSPSLPSCLSCKSGTAGEAYVTHSVSVPTGTQTLTLSFELNVLGCKLATNSGFPVAQIEVPGQMYSPALFETTTSSGTPAVLVGYLGKDGPVPVGSQVPLTEGTWTPITIEVMAESGTTALVGTSRAASVSSVNPVLAFPGEVTIGVGIDLAGPGCQVLVDNVVVEVSP